MEKLASCKAIVFFFFFLALIQSGISLGSNQHQEFHGSQGTRTLKQEQTGHHEVHCSRERSRAAWKIIDEYLVPFVKHEHYVLPTKCRLHKDNDMFREQEGNKIHIDMSEWKCGFCKKGFRSEKFLDKHLDSRHSNLLNDTQGRCLADLCGALHCDLVAETKVKKTKCNPAATARNHHLCEILAFECFPLNGGRSATKLHEFFLRQFCDSHTCKGNHKPFSRGKKKSTNVFYLAISVLIILLLPLFYLIVYLSRREMKKGVQILRRINQTSGKKKPS